MIDMIVAHHKSMYKDVRDLGILDLDDASDCFEEHSKLFPEWSHIAIDILESLGLETHEVSLEEAKENYEYVIDYCDGRKRDVLNGEGC